MRDINAYMYVLTLLEGNQTYITTYNMCIQFLYLNRV